MSISVLEPFSASPFHAKRSRETSVGLAKCGEILVSNSGDRWSFFCAHCQKLTSDIGVFICHIKLDHLTQQQSSQQAINKVVTPSFIAAAQNDSSSPPLIQIASVVSNQDIQINREQPPTNEIVKEEARLSRAKVTPEPICSKVSKIVDIISLTSQHDSQESVASNQTSTPSVSSSHSPEELNEKFFAITSLEQDDEEHQRSLNTSNQQNQEINEVIYTNELEDSEEDDDHGNKNGCETESVYSISDNENDVMIQPNESRITAPLQNRPKRSRKIPPQLRDLMQHKCPTCNQVFRSKQGVYFHISRVHDKELHHRLPYKCNECKRGFKSQQGLKYHKIKHNTRVHYKCPICPATPYKLNIFINHVLTHESSTCFPCQVCCKVYTTNKERMNHWKSHAKERPFSCNFCFRRYRKKQYLIHHLKSHNQYLCNFCLSDFNTEVTQKPPYACPTCEKLPDIKQKVEIQRNLLEKTHAFDSDED